MTPAEVREFLATRHHVALATLTSDGSPDATIVACRYRNEALELMIAPEDPALTAITTDDRVCCAAEVCPAYYELRGVSLQGRAEPLGGDTVRLHIEHTMSFDFAKINERPD